MKGIIYKWTCLKSGKSYIGQTINEERREDVLSLSTVVDIEYRQFKNKVYYACYSHQVA